MSHSKIHIVHELIRRGLLDKSEIVDGALTLADSTSRHRNAQVMRRGRPGYFVKEAVPTQAMSVQTLMREAATYRLANDPGSALAPLATLMPGFRLWDPLQHLLVLDLLPAAENVGAHVRRTGAFSPAIAAEFGRALATYHGRTAGTLTSGAPAQLFPGTPPWVLTIFQQDPASIANLSAANSQMLALIQRYPDFPRRLDALRAAWRRDTLIHGDMKFENCVVTETDAAAGPTVKVVDWEIADIGDPRWDVGSMLQAWLSYWIFSMPADGTTTDPEQLASRATYPLEQMRPAIHAFWSAYTTTMDVSGQAERELLHTCIGYGGARMVQTVYESLYQMPQLTPHAIFMLQVSLNVLEEPRAAAAELLGL